MPQKLNKAGQMQDYIPKGNGDASGEYGTSNGTNKNFTTSDKKSSANVIAENKSVVVENKGKKETLNKMYPNNPKSNVENGFSPDEWEEIYKFSKEINKKNDDLIDETYEIAEKYNLNNKDAIKKLKEKYSNNNKANVIDGDLSGKKEETLVDEKTQKEINDRISGWDNKMRYMMLSRMQSDVKYYLGAGGRSKRDLWAQDEKEHIAYMETLYNGLKEKPEWLSKKELENYKKELLKK